MDTFLGIIIAFGALIGSLFMEGGSLGQLWGPSALLIVLGGVIGALFASFPLAQVTQIPRLFAIAFGGRSPHYADTIKLIVSFAEKARREGVLALENDAAQLEDPFMRKSFGMVVDGTDPELTRTVLETEIQSIEERHESNASIFEAAAGFAPTMGIIGTVMGLVKVLSNLTDTAALAENIAVAFIATLYGVGTANLIWLPIATKLKAKSRAEILERELMMEGALSILAGDSPSMVEDKLNAYLPPALRSSSHGTHGAAEAEGSVNA